jgi:hypothetical protein
VKKGRLDEIDKRIHSIEEAIDMCDPDRDADVLFNLEHEIDILIAELEGSLNGRSH